MLESDENIFKSLIADGLIGAALGALLYKDREDEATTCELARAVILATYKANQEAQKNHLGVFVEEQGKLYEINSGGIKRFIKEITKPNTTFEKYYKLK